MSAKTIIDPLSATFAALADPTRRALLARLARGEASVNELAAPFAMSLPAVSKHIKVLEKAGLVNKERDAQWRQCRIEGAAFKQVMNWMGEYRQFWEGRFDRLDACLLVLQQNTPAITATTPKPLGNPEQGE